MNPRRTRVERSAATRQSLIDAAATVFARDGLVAAKVDTICAEAGVTTGALYAHFASKEALFQEVYRAYTGGMLARLQQAVEAGDGFTTVAAQAVRANAADPTYLVFGIEVIMRAYRDEQMRAEVQPMRRAARDGSAALLAAEARRRGVELPMPAEHLATVVRCAMNGMTLERLVDPDGAPVEAFATFFSVFFDLLEAAQASPAPQAQPRDDGDPARDPA